MPDQPRRVWLNREQRDWLDQVFAMGWGRYATPIVAAWDAAPADPTEAIGGWFDSHFPGALDNKDLNDFAEAVLRALGMPNA